MKQPLLPVGTRILALKNVGPVMNGQVGIITGIWQQDFLFWKRPTYLCTFIGNVGLAMKPSEVEAFDHGRTLEELQIKLDGLSVADQLRVIGGPLP